MNPAFLTHKLRARQTEAPKKAPKREAEALDEEITAIENALRQKNLTSDAGEKARNNVSKALTALRRKLSKGEPPAKALATHLEEHLNLGYDLIYNQPQGRVWQ